MYNIYQVRRTRIITGISEKQRDHVVLRKAGTNMFTMKT